MAELLLPFAKRRVDGVYVAPEEVPRGQACDCVCPDCDNPVLARQGEARVWHFAHLKARKCANAYVRSVHELVKQLLCERPDILLPPLESTLLRLDAYGQVVRESETVQPATCVRLDSCLRDQPLGEVDVDLLGALRGRSLIIELTVASRSFHDKLKHYERAGIAALEIDLGQFRSVQATRERVEAAVFDQLENRRWLWHPLASAARLRVADRLEQRLQAVAEAKRLEDERLHQVRTAHRVAQEAEAPHVFFSSVPDAALRWRASFPDEAQWRPARAEFARLHGLAIEAVEAVMSPVGRRSDLARVTPQQLAIDWGAALDVPAGAVFKYFRNAGYTC